MSVNRMTVGCVAQLFFKKYVVGEGERKVEGEGNSVSFSGINAE